MRMPGHGAHNHPASPYPAGRHSLSQLSYRQGVCVLQLHAVHAHNHAGSVNACIVTVSVPPVTALPGTCNAGKQLGGHTEPA